MEAEKVHLLGTDLCPKSLNRARLGRYGEWSFRGVSAAVRTAYFTSTSGNTYQLRSDLVNRAQFAQHNLAHDEAWPVAPGSVDILLCRNVLLYFNDALARQVMERMATRVRVGGWLLVGPCEVHLAYDLGLTPVPECAVAFTRPDSLAPPTSTPLVPVSDWVAPIPEQPVPAPIGDLGSAYQAAREHAERGELDAAMALLVPLLRESFEPQAVMLMAKVLADQGDLESAELLCREALQTTLDEPELHYLLGTILQERKDEEAAILAHRRALKLDDDHVLAHLAVALLLQRRGQHGEAVLHFHRVAALLRERDQSHASLAGLDPARLSELLEYVEGDPRRTKDGAAYES
jgi:chemotaxis protein methyltransferase CheR